MRIGTTTAVFAFATLCRTSLAWSAEYWVAPNDADNATGSQSAPWLTIQHAADTLKPGDTVTIADGSYAGFWMKNRQGDTQHRLTIRAENPLGAKITGPSSTASDPNDSVQLVSVSFATIDGLDVTGAPRAGISIRSLGDTTGADTTDDIVQNCRSHDNGAGMTAGRHDGIFTGFARNVIIQNDETDHNSEHGVYVSNSADDPVISGNKSHDNLANGLQINADVTTGGDGVITGWKMENNIVYANTGGAAINLDGACSGVLRNNLVYGNAGAGITLFMGDAAQASSGNVVADNTVYDPTGTRSAIQIADGANDNILFDNVFFSKGTGLEIQSVTGLLHDYNAVSSYSGGSASAHEVDPTAAQMFANAAGSDFHGASALVDKGTAALGGASASSTDLEGKPRPQGAAYDIGCYEQGVGPATSPGGDAGASSPASGGSGMMTGELPGSNGGGSSGGDAGEPTAGAGVPQGADGSAATDPASGAAAVAGGAPFGSSRAATGCRASPGQTEEAGAILVGLAIAAVGLRRRSS
jgi:parallel beta-helix repeat protein